MTRSTLAENVTFRRKLALVASNYHKNHPLDYFTGLTVRGILAFMHPSDRLEYAKEAMLSGYLAETVYKDIVSKIKFFKPWE